MRRIIAIAIVVILLSGCATWQAYTSSTITDEQKHAAICNDAAVGLALAKTMLDQMLPEDALKYWTVFAEGCELTIKAYCGSTCAENPT
jgi:PBP1b-binding outer membrane lipoprotein LpoB